MLIPNPFYAAYAAGAVAANCEPVYLPATAQTGFLPDLDALSDELLGRTVAFFIASPANPQGAARLLTAFGTWKTMEAQRRVRAEAALARIAERAGLYPDVSDIVQRSLS